MLGPGDLIFHPRYGFGSITEMTRRDARHPIKAIEVKEGVPDHAQDYYDIKLLDGGTLLVPVSRAERRRIATSHQ